MKQTMLDNHDVEVWRWNVNPAWSHFSSMIQDQFHSNNAITEFERHKTSKTCLYFAVSAVDSFMNQELRIILKNNKIKDDKICKILTGKERRKHIEETQFGVIYVDDYYKKYEYYKEIRNEITHPDRKDQLIKDYLDIINTIELVNIVKYIFVKICELQDKEFQYWMLGWNYIGFNSNALEPYLSNNMNGFFHSMCNMNISGFDYGFPMNFTNMYMKNYEQFKVMEKSLLNFPFEIEFQLTWCPDRPRLTRKWWNKSVLEPDTWLTCPDDPENMGCKLGWAVLDNGSKCLGFFDTKEKAMYIQRINGLNYHVSYAVIDLATNIVRPISS